MCGFVGWINVNDEEGVELSVLQAMNRQLSHRGPDDEGLYNDRNQNGIVFYHFDITINI